MRLILPGPGDPGRFRPPAVQTVLVFLMVFGVLLFVLGVIIGLGVVQLIVTGVLAALVTAWLKPRDRRALPPNPDDVPYDPGGHTGGRADPDPPRPLHPGV